MKNLKIFLVGLLIGIPMLILTIVAGEMFDEHGFMNIVFFVWQAVMWIILFSYERKF